MARVFVERRSGAKDLAHEVEGSQAAHELHQAALLLASRRIEVLTTPVAVYKHARGCTLGKKLRNSLIYIGIESDATSEVSLAHFSLNPN
jgi:hypothetical protein